MRPSTHLSRQVRAISGVAPVLHFPKVTKNPDQVKINTERALETLRAQLGPKPEPFTRQFTTSIDDVKRYAESVLQSCGSGGDLVDGQELTQLQVIERVLRHGIVSYLKNEGKASWEEIEKWLVYTQTDQTEFSRLKREYELQQRSAVYRAENKAPVAPEIDWAAEYAAALDREVVSEKRKRYDTIAATSYERDESAIQAELRAYREPSQAALLDQLVKQINMFKPYLAKQVIQAKLVERNAAGELTFSRFADWNPDARDLAEVFAENELETPGTPLPISIDEWTRRYADVRMKTKGEILAQMESVQQAALAKSGGGGSSSGGDVKRAQLIAEIVRLQQRGSADVSANEAASGETPEEKEAKAAAIKAANEKEAAKYRVSDSVIAEKGLLGLGFISHSKGETAAASA